MRKILRNITAHIKLFFYARPLRKLYVNSDGKVCKHCSYCVCSSDHNDCSERRIKFL